MLENSFDADMLKVTWSGSGGPDFDFNYYMPVNRVYGFVIVCTPVNRVHNKCLLDVTK